MRRNGIQVLFSVLTLCLAFAGCGFDTLQESVKLRLSFSVDEETGLFAAEKDYRPDDNPDIANNRERIEDGVLQVRSMSVILTRIGEKNEAKFAWGKVYASVKGQAMSDEEIQKDASKPCAESAASACFEAVALIPTDTTDADSQDRGGLALDITPDQKRALIDLVFNNPELTVKMVGWTDQKDKPVAFDADVVFNLDISASIL